LWPALLGKYERVTYTNTCEGKQMDIRNEILQNALKSKSLMDETYCKSKMGYKHKEMP
jgi:hypothetical protein